MLNRSPQCTQVKIEPIETRKHKLNNKKKIVLRHILTIFHLSQEHCSYAPFLFMFLMFFLPSVVSNVTTLILSLVGSTLVIILHLIYVMWQQFVVQELLWSHSQYVTLTPPWNPWYTWWSTRSSRSPSPQVSTCLTCFSSLPWTTSGTMVTLDEVANAENYDLISHLNPLSPSSSDQVFSPVPSSRLSPISTASSPWPEETTFCCWCFLHYPRPCW